MWNHDAMTVLGMPNRAVQEVSDADVTVTSPIFEVGADIAEHVASGGECFSAISRTNNYIFACRDALEAVND